MPEISIIIPCLNEEKYIDSCIESIINLNLKDYELIFIDGGSSDNTVEIIESYRKKNREIKLLFNPKKITPISMNMGVKASKGEYIFIISAHAKYGDNYFITLVKYIKDLNANCVGGILLTEVKNSNKKSNSIKEILSHKFGVGNADFRTGSLEIKEVDTVAFGCYSKESFEKYGLYDERLIRNQDIELNKRIINGGGKIYLIPDIKCIYYARENFTDLAKNNFANGKWNILTAYYTKTLNSLSLRHFIPLLFVLSLLVPLLLSLFVPKFVYVALLSLSSYFALVIIISFKLRDNQNSFFYLIMSFFTLHLSYGMGSLIGIFSLLKKFIVNKFIKGDR
jgi:glycosyltransferase involved in cell wall biosynthesis